MEALMLEALLFLIFAALFVAAVPFLFRLLVWIVSSTLDAPFVPTPARYAEIIVAVLECSPGDVVYELGCGDGAFMLACAKLAPRTRFVGIERNPLLCVLALAKKRFGGDPSNVEFRHGNFFKTDLSKATKIYAYLLDTVMFQLTPKLKKEFKGRIASRAFPIPHKELSNVIALTENIGEHGQHLLFVYDFE